MSWILDKLFVAIFSKLCLVRYTDWVIIFLSLYSSGLWMCFYYVEHFMLPYAAVVCMSEGGGGGKKDWGGEGGMCIKLWKFSEAKLILIVY